MEYEKGFYQDAIAKALTGTTVVEVNWLEGNILKAEVTKKKRVKG